MPPLVLIIERRKEVANALEEVVLSANYRPIVIAHLERLSDIGIEPAAIIVRISFEGITEPPHAVLERLGVDRPPVVAIAWDEDEIAEAARLKCDVVLRPQDVGRLCEALGSVTGG